MSARFSKEFKDAALADFARRKQQSPQLSIRKYVYEKRRTDPNFTVAFSTFCQWVKSSASTSSIAVTTWVNDDVALVQPAPQIMSAAKASQRNKAAPRTKAAPRIKATPRMEADMANLEIKVGGMQFVVHSAADAELFCRISTAMQLQSGF